MILENRRRLGLAAASLAVAGLAAGLLCVQRLDRLVASAASEERVRSARVKPLAFRPLPPPETPLGVAGDGAVLGLAAAGSALYTAGGSGFSDGVRALDVSQGLPSLRLQAVATWRGTPVIAFERGGWARLPKTGPEEASSGWGRLEVRTFLETEGGELLVGARQGLFRASYASGELERLDRESVRALALLPAGEIIAGGETGLRLVSPSGAPARRVSTPDPWIEDVGFDSATSSLWASTPLGVAFGRPRAAALSLHPRGGDAGRGVLVGGEWRTIPVAGNARVVSLRAEGTRREESTPEAFRRLFTAGGRLFADGPSGLFLRDPSRGWIRIRKKPEGSLPRPHVNALAADGRTLWAGFFDGGLARRSLDLSPAWTPLEGSAAWGVNALLPAGGTLFAATLRGAFRVNENRATPLEGGGGAFSLAATSSGVAVGYGKGVFLPQKRLLSAFHGLPGNQACALAYSAPNEALWVGTPSGLGRIERRRAEAKAMPGEGKLPHPWVTALVELGDALLVATYGGGVASLRGEGRLERWQRFVETEGLKVNAGAMVADSSGRVFFGTQGHGLWRSDPAVTRFERLDLPLPSPDVFSLAVARERGGETLFVGTDEGLAWLRLSPNPSVPEGEVR